MLSSAMYCMCEPGNTGGRYTTEAAAVLSRIWHRDPLQRVQRRATDLSLLTADLRDHNCVAMFSEDIMMKIN